jgi:malate dehydrogenase
MRPKVTVVGAGNVGGTTALLLAMRDLADIVLVDIVEGLAKGKALDIAEALPVLGSRVQVTGTTDWAEAEGSELVVVTSGVARKPGMSRDDLLVANTRIVSSVASEIRARCPAAVVIVVSNPLDAMAQLTLEVTGFGRERVIGMAGVLDTARFRHFAGQAAGLPGADVDALVLGSHGDLMVALPRLATAGDVPLTDMLDDPVIESLCARTADGGAEIVSLLGTGSAFVAPAASVSTMAEAVLLDQGRVLPASVFLEGEFGIEGVFLGVPVRLGSSGLAEVIEIELAPGESAALRASADSVRGLVARMHELAQS